MARHFYQWRGGCTNVIFVFLDERGRKGKRGTPRIVTQCRSQSKLMFFFYSSIYITICKILLAFLEYKVEFRFREKRVFNSNFEFLLVLKNTIFLTYWKIFSTLKWSQTCICFKRPSFFINTVFLLLLLLLNYTSHTFLSKRVKTRTRNWCRKFCDALCFCYIYS